MGERVRAAMVCSVLFACAAARSPGLAGEAAEGDAPDAGFVGGKGPTPKVLDAGTPARRGLSRMLGEAGHVELRKWDRKMLARPRPNESWALAQGRNYAVVFRMVSRRREDGPEVSGHMGLYIARGGMRYICNPPRFLEIVDERGRDMTPPMQLKAEEENPEWWRRTVLQNSVWGEGSTRLSVDFDMRLPGPDVKEVQTARGEIHAIFPVGWRRFGVRDLDTPRRVPGFESMGLRMEWLGHQTRQGKKGYFFRLRRLEDYEPVDYLHGADTPQIVAHSVDGKVRTLRRLSVWSYKRYKQAGGWWDFIVYGERGDFHELELGFVTETALVRFPFEFEHVPIPPAPKREVSPSRGMGRGTERCA
ncbi:MAG: hypothetical protein ACYTFI_19030 [Planctomycetota bacterium]